ncbi:hypothetical protein ACFLZL_05405, partial [Thermodesulfobacteriota bacterium]
ILIDDVTGLTLSYAKAGGTWVQGTDDIADLFNVTVDLVMSREDSEIGDKTFSTTIRPRNTNY